MHLKFRNVNEAFRIIITGIHRGAIPTYSTDSRNGGVLQVCEPFCVTYSHPRERVLFNKARDANYFFHLYEAMWMLAGRNDVAALEYYLPRFRNYSDDGATLNGAYGYRWRHAKQPRALVDEICPEGFINSNVDQLQVLIEHLKAKPESRRAVLQMWNVEDDLLKIDESKDVCCNLSVMFSIRGIKELSDHPDAGVTHAIWNRRRVLDMTVTNRSNDLIWGMLGANYVHFSFLQEYMAGMLGVEVGTYTHFTNNLHVYTENNSGWEPKKLLAEYAGEHDSYERNVGVALPLIGIRDRFDSICSRFVDLNKNGDEATADTGVGWSASSFLSQTAQPAMHAFHMHKARDYDAALYWCAKIDSGDWRVACTRWIEKRKALWETKQDASV